MIRVLFVCLGNICRSPMAEAVLKHLVRENGLEDKIEVDSAGTGNWHIGEPPHEGTQRILADYGMDYDGLTARQIIEKDMEVFDYIIAMDAENIGELHRIAGHKKTGHIARLLDFVEGSQEDDVPDPYFTGNFEAVYDLVSKGCTNLLAYIKKQEEISG